MNRTPLSRAPRRPPVAGLFATHYSTGFLLSFWLFVVVSAGCSTETICPEGSTEQQGTCVLGQTKDIPSDWVPSIGMDSFGDQSPNNNETSNFLDTPPSPDSPTPQAQGDGTEGPSSRMIQPEIQLRRYPFTVGVSSRCLSQNETYGFLVGGTDSTTSSPSHPNIDMLHASLPTRLPMRRIIRGLHAQNYAPKYPTGRGARSYRRG